jgi:hypothetical protein
MEQPRVVVDLIGGPCDGELLDLSGAPHTVETGVALPSPGSAYPGGRSLYDARPNEPGRLYWSGEVP